MVYEAKVAKITELLVQANVVKITSLVRMTVVRMTGLVVVIN